MTNWLNPESIPIRIVLLTGMLTSLLMAIAIPAAFEDRALLFAGGYVAHQFVHNLVIVLAVAKDEPLHRSFVRILVWNSWVPSAAIRVNAPVAMRATSHCRCWKGRSSVTSSASVRSDALICVAIGRRGCEARPEPAAGTAGWLNAVCVVLSPCPRHTVETAQPG
jgi:low temperature requirement A protein (LtrA)